MWLPFRKFALVMVKKKKKKTSLRKRRRRQIMAIKLTLAFIAIALPCLWFVRQETVENEPLRVAKEFADNMIHDRFSEAYMLATPESAPEIDLFAEWVGSQDDELRNGTARFKVTHAQILMPDDTTNVVQGKVLVKDRRGKEHAALSMLLNLVKEGDVWLVDYRADLF